MENDAEPIPSLDSDDGGLKKEETIQIIQTTCPKKLGTCIALFYRNGNPFVTIGPNCISVLLGCMYFCLVSIVTAITYLYLCFMWKYSTLGFTLGFIITITQFITYHMTCFLNPGIPNRDLSRYDQAFLAEIYKDNRRFCAICNLVKQEGSFIVHCQECDVCVEGIKVN